MKNRAAFLRAPGQPGSRLHLLFLAAVVVPAGLLGFLAVRSIDREEAYIEKQLERTLAAELVHVTGLLNAELDRVREDIERSAPESDVGNPAALSSAWRAADPLVRTPYLLSPEFEILWPQPTAAASDDEIAFLKFNREFVMDRAEIPVYQNIVQVYSREIAGLADETAADEAGPARSGDVRVEAVPSPWLSAGIPDKPVEQGETLSDIIKSRPGESAAVAADMRADAPVPAVSPAKSGLAAPKPQTAREAQALGGEIDQKSVSERMRTSAGPASVKPQEKAEGLLTGGEIEKTGAFPAKTVTAQKGETAAAFALKTGEEPGKKDKFPDRRQVDPPPDYAATQTALKEFESSEDVRRQVYQQARERGREPLSRVVLPAAGRASKQEETDREESLFISEPMTFSRIIADRESGLIPRFLGEELVLFFWKRTPGGGILGSVLDSAVLKSRLLGTLPEAATASRILTVLDEAGRPLYAPEEEAGRDWRRPFVSREISELLPRWEAAAYLADPGLIRSRADFRAFVMWVTVLVFLVSILAGGTLVLRTLRREMETARNKTTFVTNVSHELKTPLTSIRMFAEMLKEGRQADPVKKDQYLGLMVSETDRLTRLINNVLDFSRMDRGKKSYSPEVLDAARLARDIAEGQRPRLEHNDFTLAVRTPPEPLFVRADGEALKQAVLNLLSNAENYSDAEREIEVEAAADSGQAVIRILDRGIGVSDRHARLIFQEFFRADDSLTARTKGTGLGLAIARRLMRDQGGDITYAPRTGGGSVFEVRLPRAEAS